MTVITAMFIPPITITITAKTMRPAKPHLAMFTGSAMRRRFPFSLRDMPRRRQHACPTPTSVGAIRPA